MPINPNIAGSIRPIEIASPLAMAGQLAQIETSRNQNAILQAKLAEDAREAMTLNALNRAYQSAVDPATGQVDLNKLRTSLASGNLGSKIPGAEKAYNESQKAGYESQKAFGDLVAKRMELSRASLEGVSTPEEYIAWHEANHRDPVLGQYFAARGITADQARARIAQAIRTPGSFQTLLTESKLGLEKALENHFVNQDLGGSERTIVMPKYGRGPAQVVPGSEARKTMTPGESARLAQDKEQFNENQKSPVLTTIVNPDKPDEMIVVNAREYRGGGAQAPGVVGTSGNEPKAALRKAKAEEGKNNVNNILDELQTAYDSLNRQGAIASTERGVLSNALSVAAATGPGQVASRIAGTEAQVERDVISSSRIRLLNAIKNATGMSAQQLNSNVELQTWMKAVTDPGQQYESVVRNLQNIRNFIATANKGEAGSPAAPSAPPPLSSFERNKK